MEGLEYILTDLLSRQVTLIFTDGSSKHTLAGLLAMESMPVTPLHCPHTCLGPVAKPTMQPNSWLLFGHSNFFLPDKFPFAPIHNTLSLES